MILSNRTSNLFEDPQVIDHLDFVFDDAREITALLDKLHHERKQIYSPLTTLEKENFARLRRLFQRAEKLQSKSKQMIH